MTLDEIDKSELILESYNIEGIHVSECRSIFLDWVLKLPELVNQPDAIRFMIKTYAIADAKHPMSVVLNSALETSPKTGRKGGRAGRINS